MNSELKNPTNEYSSLVTEQQDQHSYYSQSLQIVNSEDSHSDDLEHNDYTQTKVA